MVSLFLVADRPIVRMGLRNVFEASAEVELVGEECGLVPAADAWRRRLTLPDVVVVALSSSDASVLRGVQVMDSGAPAVVMIGHDGDGPSALRAMLAGCGAYLSADDGPETVLAATEAVAGGAVVLCSPAARELLLRLRLQLEPARRTQLNGLTARERAVLALLAAGRSNHEIARELLLSEATTVKKHLSHMLHKLGLQTRLKAGLWGYQCGLGSTGPLDTAEPAAGT